MDGHDSDMCALERQIRLLPRSSQQNHHQSIKNVPVSTPSTPFYQNCPQDLNFLMSTFNPNFEKNLTTSTFESWQTPPPGFSNDFSTSRATSNRNCPSQQNSILFSNPEVMNRLPRFTNTISTQTERSVVEEKFLFRESILQGCDVINDLAQTNSNLKEFSPYTELLREKTMQSRSQSLCNLPVDQNSAEKVVSEYIKMFIKVSDSWLEARNCFGLDEKCLFECQSTKDIACNYVEWMNSSRTLLGSIMAHLKSEKNKQPVAEPPLEMVHVPSQWSVPKVMAEKMKKTWYPTPLPPQVFTVTQTDADDSYLRPASYEVPKKKLTDEKKMINVKNAKKQAWQDVPITTAHVLQIPRVEPKREGSSSSKESSVKGGKSEAGQSEDSSSEESFFKGFSSGAVQKISGSPWKKNIFTKAQATAAAHIIKELLLQWDKGRSGQPLNYSFGDMYKKKKPLTLQKIGNKLKSNVYENVQQFVHDCRLFFKSAILSIEEPKDKERLQKLSKDFEKMLENGLENAHEWKHVTGDGKELTFYRELQNNQQSQRNFQF